MINARRHLERTGSVGVLLVLLLQPMACSTYRPYEAPPRAEPLLSIGEWLSFSGYDLTFYEDGLVVLQKGGPEDKVSLLHPRELSRLKGFLNSKEFAAAVELLRMRGYRPGCCDLHEVSFVFRGESLGYPLWQPDCQERIVEEPVAGFINLVNELGRRHFRHLRRNPLPQTTCD